MSGIVHHIALVVRDPARSATIFQQLFGATVTAPSAERKGPPETIVELRGIQLALVKGESSQARTDDHVAFAVREADLPGLASRLAALGIESHASRAGPGAKSLYFADDDNHLFELHAGQAGFAEAAADASSPPR